MKTVLTALTTWSACRGTRWYLDRSSRRETTHLGGCVKLTALWNHGAAFGLPLGRKWLPVLSGAALTALLMQRKKAPVAAGLILGGGLSNLQERVGEGRVYDYLRFPKVPKPLNRYVYNLADLAVFAGSLALVLREKTKD